MFWGYHHFGKLPHVTSPDWMKNKTSEKKPIHQKLHSTISSTAFRVISWQCSRCEGSYCKVTAQSSWVYHPMCPHQCDLGTSSTASSCFINNLQTHSQKQKNIEPKKHEALYCYPKLIKRESIVLLHRSAQGRIDISSKLSSSQFQKDIWTIKWQVQVNGLKLHNSKQNLCLLTQLHLRRFEVV